MTPAGIEGSTFSGHLIRTPIYWVIIVLVSLSALTFPLQAQVQLELIAKFQNLEIELDVVTVVDSEAEASGRVALLGIATPLRSSFSFKREEWLLLIALWSKAVKAQSDSWKIIGSMKETETSDPSLLTISAGPGIKLVINSPRKGLVTYVLSKDDLARFAGTLYRVKEFFPDSAANRNQRPTANVNQQRRGQPFPTHRPSLLIERSRFRGI